MPALAVDDEATKLIDSSGSQHWVNLREDCGLGGTGVSCPIGLVA